MNKSFFELFGLEEKINLDSKDLQKRFYALSRELHPDFHHGSTKAEQAQSLDASGFLNQAFSTLKDREKRILYLLSRRLGDITDAQKKQTPPELLMELMEIREELEAFKAAPSPHIRSRLESARADLHARQTDIDQTIDRFAEAFDAQKDSVTQKQILSDIRAALLKKNFLRSLLNTIDAELNPSEA
jgi:molecular chaperone HscB